MSGPDTAALREQVTRWMRDDDGCANSIPASPDDVLALLDECDRLRAERDEEHERNRRWLFEEESKLKAAEDWARTMEHERDFEQVVSEDYRKRAEAAEALAARYEQALREIAREYERWDDADREHPWDDVRAAWNAITTAEAALAAGSGEERDE